MVTASHRPITLEYLRSRRDEIMALARQNKASNVRVFGSVAKGQSTGASDVDFLVTFDDGASLLDQVGLILDLSDLLGTEIDVAPEDGLRPRYRESILTGAVAL